MNKEMLSSLVGKVIKVDRGGPESRIGMLLSGNEQYLTLLTEDDGIVYYKTHHIKSITDNSKNEMSIDVELPTGFKLIEEADFAGVLKTLEYQWVKINRGGPETLEGVVKAVTNDFVEIVFNEEVIRLSMFHIRNVSHGVKFERAKEKDMQEESKDSTKKE
ncbi:hypothetical protein ORD22_07580 [Sporosarcina sp. GW1-11]|uniref:hypothetical protein n=1 Tax=Sporosarcina sp. GW1-11 TaxID=2899126 RepID=UPI00294C91F5|nr:hypothetical protein [Sporosarcina sp. GW1-11]MDV6378111.1 hypothetical protein [Sporosarcina sp. GW1-11]